MTWQIDTSHTRANFHVRHMMISNVHGQFDKVSGTVEFDEKDPTRSTVDVKIDAASLYTHDDKRDAHLKSADFLDVDNHPYLLFKSQRVEKIDDVTGRVYGDLTIRGVSKPVTLDVEFNGLAKAPWGATSAGFSAKTKINRKDWGLNWNMALETGGVLVGDTVNITIEAEIVKQDVPQAAAVAN